MQQAEDKRNMSEDKNRRQNNEDRRQKTVDGRYGKESIWVASNFRPQNNANNYVIVNFEAVNPTL